MSEVVIIGSGLGGLLCGAILSKAGRTVTVLEKNPVIGGCLQSFVRDGLRFETGFHSVAGLEKGGPLERIFRPLGLMDLPWEKVEETDEIVLDGVSRHLPDIPLVPGEGLAVKHFGIKAPLLMGSALRLSSPASETTLDEYIHVMGPFMKGSWRLPSGDLIARHLASLIRGSVRTRCEVTGIRQGAVRCADGTTYRGTIISDIHPRRTFALYDGHVRPSYLHRLASLGDGPGIFTVYCKLFPGTRRYQPWSTTLDGSLMLHYGNPDAEGYARSVDLLAFSPSQVPDREAFAKEMIARVPGLGTAVEQFWTSTPETWERYTGTPGGTAFGIRKKDATCYVHPRTPVPGLYLTGQNCGLHGVLGVAETAVATCREILGEETLNQIMNP